MRCTISLYTHILLFLLVIIGSIQAEFIVSEWQGIYCTSDSLFEIHDVIALNNQDHAIAGERIILHNGEYIHESYSGVFGYKGVLKGGTLIGKSKNSYSERVERGNCLEKESDSSFVVGGDNGRITRFDLNGSIIKEAVFKHKDNVQNNISRIRVKPDGTISAICNDDNTTIKWDISSDLNQADTTKYCGNPFKYFFNLNNDGEETYAEKNHVYFGSLEYIVGNTTNSGTSILSAIECRKGRRLALYKESPAEGLVIKDLDIGTTIPLNLDGDDADFLELNSGNFLVVTKHNGKSQEGSRMMVIDSLLKSVIAEEEISNYYRVQSACAIGDSGFTVVGSDYKNGWMAHYIVRDDNKVDTKKFTQFLFKNNPTMRCSGKVLYIQNVSEPFKLHIVNVSGRTLFQKDIHMSSGNTINLNLNRLSTGVYYALLKLDNRIFTKSIFVK